MSHTPSLGSRNMCLCAPSITPTPHPRLCNDLLSYSKLNLISDVITVPPPRISLFMLISTQKDLRMDFLLTPLPAAINLNTVCGDLSLAAPWTTYIVCAVDGRASALLPSASVCCGQPTPRSAAPIAPKPTRSAHTR